MDKSQFYFEYYKLEDDRRTKIRHNLSFLLAIFSVLIGVMIFYLQNLTCIDLNWIGIIFYIIIAIIFLLFAINVYYFIKAYHNYSYGYLPTPVTIENDIKNKLGDDIFEGGCFFHSMLVELSGQSAAMSKHILGGFRQLAELLCTWLEQAGQQGLLKKGLNFNEIANYIIISLNGAAALYASSRDPAILDHAVSQLRFYIQQIKA